MGGSTALTQEGRLMSLETQKTQDPKPGKVPIYIDGTKYHPEGGKLSGTQIRTVPAPSVSDDRDLWLDVVDGLDELIEDDQIVELVPNMRFFTVPRVINPGQTSRV
jgi:hypothetical protein